MFRNLWRKFLTCATQTSPGMRRSKKSQSPRSCRLFPELLENRTVPALFLGPTADWMSLIPGTTSLNQLSIPGTHDTMTEGFASTDPLIAPFAQTQDLDLGTQLDHGIRFLDIRCGPIYSSNGLRTDDFGLYHGPLHIGNESFVSDVLGVCQTFLAAHHNETIIMSIKNDYPGEIFPALTSDQFDSFFHSIWEASQSSWYIGPTVPS